MLWHKELSGLVHKPLSPLKCFEMASKRNFEKSVSIAATDSCDTFVLCRCCIFRMKFSVKGWSPMPLSPSSSDTRYALSSLPDPSSWQSRQHCPAIATLPSDRMWACSPSMWLLLKLKSSSSICFIHPSSIWCYKVKKSFGIPERNDHLFPWTTV